MENATKALLIAAAVLVAIIIISITLVIVNQGQEAASGADLSELEAAEFNAPFLMYEGNNVSTDQLNVLLGTVFQHNKQELASGKKRYVDVSLVYETRKPAGTASRREITVLATKVLLKESRTTSNTVPSISGSKYYTVECRYTGTIITSITVTEK